MTAGDPIEVEITLENGGDADGTRDVSLQVAGEEVLEEEIDVPAGENASRVLAGPETSRTGTMTVSLDGQTVGDATVRPPDVLHVAPDGSGEDVGTESEPLSSIQTAVERAGPGQTVSVHPGECVEYVEFHAAGEPDAPITLTGPPDAVSKPPEEIDHQVISVGASHVHITGLTVTGLHDGGDTGAPESYHSGKLSDLNSFPEDGDDYIEGLVTSPHRIGNASQAPINSQMIKAREIGGFEVIGPAGAEWIFDESVYDHNGEIVYLGTADGNRRDRGFEGFDRTRNIRIRHVDNSAGHPTPNWSTVREAFETSRSSIARTAAAHSPTTVITPSPSLSVAIDAPFGGT